jgi:WD40 repeat protein
VPDAARLSIPCGTLICVTDTYSDCLPCCALRAPVKDDSMFRRRISRRAFLALSMAVTASPLAAEGIPQLAASRTLPLPADNQVGESSVVTAVAISPDGRLVAAAGDDHLVHVWTLPEGKRLHSLRGHLDWVRSLSFSVDGTRLASGGDDRRTIIWDVVNGQQVNQLGGNDRPIYCLRYSPDGRTLASVGFDRQLKLYEAGTGDLATVLACPCVDMRAVAFSPDGSLMASAGRNGRVRVWDMSVQGVAFERDAQDRRIRALAFSGDGQQLALAGEGQQIVILDGRTGQPLATVPQTAGRVLTLAYVGPHRLASGSSDNSIQIWDVTTAREERRLIGHRGSVSSLAFEPRRGLLVSGSFDTTLRIWQLAGEGQQTTRRLHGSNSR